MRLTTGASLPRPTSLDTQTNTHEVEEVEEPGEELDGVALLPDAEVLLARRGHLLEEVVRGDGALEVVLAPQPPHHLPEPQHQRALARAHALHLPRFQRLVGPSVGWIDSVTN